MENDPILLVNGSAAMAAMKTMQMIVKGRVQGVSFRANVQKRARELGLFGYAKNLANGDVEVIAQGEHAALLQLKEFIIINPGRAAIDFVVEEEIERQNFSSFAIQ